MLPERRNQGEMMWRPAGEAGDSRHRRNEARREEIEIGGEPLEVHAHGNVAGR